MTSPGDAGGGPPRRGQVAPAVGRSVLLTGLLFSCLSFAAGRQAGITVNLYNPVEPSGQDGEACTAAMLNETSYASGLSPVWSVHGHVYVSTSKAMPLPTPVTVGGVTHREAGKKCIRVPNGECGSTVRFNVGPLFFSKITVAAFLTPGGAPSGAWRRWDTMTVVESTARGPFWSCQTYHPGSGKTYLQSHSATPSGSTFSPGIEVQPGKTYWVNLPFDGEARKCRLAVFDPAASYAPVGPTVECAAGGMSPSGPDRVMANFRFGRADGIEQGPTDSFTYFDHIMLDSEKGTFPIYPSGGSGPNPPSRPRE